MDEGEWLAAAVAHLMRDSTGLDRLPCEVEKLNN